MDLLALLRDPNAAPSPVGPIQEAPRATMHPLPSTSSAQLAAVAPSRARPNFAATSAPTADKRSLLFKNNGRRDEASKRDQRKAIAFEDKRWKRSEMLAKRRPGLEEAKKETSPGVKATGRTRIRAGPESLRGGKEAVADRLRRFQEERTRKREEERKKKKQPFKVGVYKLENTSQDKFTPLAKVAFSSGRKRKIEPVKGHASNQHVNKIGEQKKPKAAKALKMEAALFKRPEAKQELSKNKSLNLSSDVAPLRRSTRLATKPASSLATCVEINRLETLAEEQAKAETPRYLDATTASDFTSSGKSSSDKYGRRSTRTAALCSTEEEGEDALDDVFGSAPPAMLQTPLRPTASNTFLTPALEALKINSEAWQMKSSPRRSRRLSKADIPAFSSTLDKPETPKPSLLSPAPKLTFNFISQADQKNFQFSAQPLLDQSLPDAALFKTPTSAARRKRLSEFPRLLDPLRSDINFQRGSVSERRRRRKGQNPFDMVHNFGLEDVPDDPNSPVHAQLAEIFKQKKQVETEGKRVEESDILEKVETILSAEKRRVSAGSPRNFGEELQAMETSEGAPDVAYFRQLLQTESSDLDRLGEAWEAKLASAEGAKAIPEESQGQVRAVIGKSRLLLAKKGRFGQFATLIDDCELMRGEKKTTVTDLQGFWEMIYVQVKDIQEAFDGLDRLETNSWVPIVEAAVEQENRKPKAKKRPLPTKANPPAKVSAKIREMMANKKREMLPQPHVPGAAASMASPQVQAVKDDEKKFDGVFFEVRSPLRKMAAANSSARKGPAAKLTFTGE